MSITVQGKYAVRIPLDYYRILGLPLAASEDQLRQAYSDRVVQLPRREYSAAAISARKQLIEEAYLVLSDPRKRMTYDQLYLAHAYAPDSTVATISRESSHRDHDAQSLSIEIAQDELVGALLILQELGEYELVLQLGRPYLVNKNRAVTIRTGHNLASEEVLKTVELPDIILTVALSCLELGREQWQQGHYENAAVSLETGEELLLREGLFPSIQAEIASDLYKLRPYRILELLALPLEKITERRKGLGLLQSILEDRGGIDGTGNDESGLNIDDFLRFIQQLRNHLTVAEQHKLFEAQSKRPSAVATYLAVYALIARGFAQGQPALIRQAKQMLMRLGKRQDVHLEQSLCALLLGQTEEATRVLEMSQEYEALAFIREKSQDSPDLLPGLCLYGEQWLQQEVFPHFRDLAKQQVSLKDYFADQQVQAYLEALPTDAQTKDEWTVINHQSFRQPLSNTPEQWRQPEYSYAPDPGLLETPISNPSISGGSEQPDIVEPRDRGNKQLSNVPSQPPKRRQRPQPQVSRYSSGNHQRHPRRRRTIDAKTRLLRIVLILCGSVLILWLLITLSFNWLKQLFFPEPSLQGPQLIVELNQPPVTIPDNNSKPQLLGGPLTETAAEEVIQTWLSTKAVALGPKHKTSGLEQILTGAALSQWQSIAREDQVSNRYRKYSHALKVETIDKSESNPNHALVEATVKEATKIYENGQIQNSTDESLRVRYDLIRKESVWRIQNMSVVSKSV
jgi:hypothetical protein